MADYSYAYEGDPKPSPSVPEYVKTAVKEQLDRIDFQMGGIDEAVEVAEINLRHAVEKRDRYLKEKAELEGWLRDNG